MILIPLSDPEIPGSESGIRIIFAKSHLLVLVHDG
ncbi:hypothetical protein BJ956_002505 [Arthrobacter psychrochitiniphilus]|nr:hypothetical protein [Arthrobacter psychrochitiniphilus]